jgi:hypothetical protein
MASRLTHRCRRNLSSRGCLSEEHGTEACVIAEGGRSGGVEILDSVGSGTGGSSIWRPRARRPVAGKRTSDLARSTGVKATSRLASLRFSLLGLAPPLPEQMLLLRLIHPYFSSVHELLQLQCSTSAIPCSSTLPIPCCSTSAAPC